MRARRTVQNLCATFLVRCCLILVASASMLGQTAEFVYAADKPLVIAFQKQKDPTTLKSDAEKLGDTLSNALHREVETRVPSDYASVVQALVSKTADVAYLDSMSFLLARRDAGAELLLAEERLDSKGVARSEYDSILVVPVGSNITSFQDLQKNAAQLRIAFTSPTSTSGYVFPYRKFVEAGMLDAGADVRNVFKEVRFAGSYSQALSALLQGSADVAAVSFYALESEGSPHIAPEQAKLLRVLERIPGVPTHVIAVRSGLTEAFKQELANAFVELGKSSPELLKDLYGASRFVRVDSASHVKASEQAIAALGIPLDSIVGR